MFIFHLKLYLLILLFILWLLILPRSSILLLIVDCVLFFILYDGFYEAPKCVVFKCSSKINEINYSIPCVRNSYRPPIYL